MIFVLTLFITFIDSMVASFEVTIEVWAAITGAFCATLGSIIVLHIQRSYDNRNSKQSEIEAALGGLLVHVKSVCRSRFKAAEAQIQAQLYILQAKYLKSNPPDVDLETTTTSPEFMMQEMRAASRRLDHHNDLAHMSEAQIQASLFLLSRLMPNQYPEIAGKVQQAIEFLPERITIPPMYSDQVRHGMITKIDEAEAIYNTRYTAFKTYVEELTK